LLQGVSPPTLEYAFWQILDPSNVIVNNTCLQKLYSLLEW